MSQPQTTAPAIGSKPVFRKAERKKAKIRIGVFGPSGSGKTEGALRIAHGIAPWEKIAIIDSENGSADLYSHLGAFNVVGLMPPFSPESYIAAIKSCEENGMDVIIIDSMTHEWEGTGGLKEIVDQLTVVMKDGRLAWNKAGLRHNKFMDTILQSPCHMIITARSKQEMAMVEGANGRKHSEKIGMKTVTREGLDYEMTVAFDIDILHYATCTKDRTKGEDGLALFQDKPAFKIDESVGRAIKKWSETGGINVMDLKRDIVRHLKRLGFNDLTEKTKIEKIVRAVTQKELNDENLESIADMLARADKETIGTVDLTEPATPAETIADQFAGEVVPEEQPEEIGEMPEPEPTPQPAAKPAPRAKTSPAMAAIEKYKKLFDVATTASEVDDVLGSATGLDPDVYGSKVVEATVKGLASDRKAALAEKPESKSDACGDGQCGTCSTCIGKDIKV